MNERAEPVEISTRMRPGEWTPGSLKELTASYQQKLREMGAPEAEIRTSVETPQDGSAQVHVSWQHHGQGTFSDSGQRTGENADISRGDGEAIPQGVPTKDSQGLGAVLGDAERSAIDEPPTGRAMAEKANHSMAGLKIVTDDQGKTYVEDIGPAKA